MSALPDAAVTRLSAILPAPGTWTTNYRPPPRFDTASFDSYRPNDPTQVTALERVRSFAAGIGPVARRRILLPWGRPAVRGPRGLYLDGAFGVGKTHLLAAVWHAAKDVPRAYLSFQELVYLTGAMGIARAREELKGLRLLCLDEFELDDPGNTLIIKTLLQTLFEQGASVVTTSNTSAEAQGQGRFNAEDFAREIQGIAAYFEPVPLAGPDYRLRAGQHRDPALPEAIAAEPGDGVVEADWAELGGVLRELHPVAYGSMLEPVATLYLHGLDTIRSQADALRFVHFIDRIYDRRVKLRFSAAPGLRGDLRELFHPSYRNSAYVKKHDRCISRLRELLSEADVALTAGQPA